MSSRQISHENMQQDQIEKLVNLQFYKFKFQTYMYFLLKQHGKWNIYFLFSFVKTPNVPLHMQIDTSSYSKHPWCYKHALQVDSCDTKVWLS